MLKKSGSMHYILIAFILGLVVLSFALYFIFQEYFTSDTIDMESCRQSVILRGTLPESDFAGLTLASFKDDFPLKCKTQVKEITKEDVEKDRAGKIVADAMVECWSIYGNGDYQIFPSAFFGTDSFCIPCARISLTEEAKDYLRKNNDTTIDIQDTLEKKVYKKTLYLEYLNNVGERPAIGSLRELGADSFSIGGNSSRLDRVADAFFKYFKYVPIVAIINIFRDVEVQKIYEPKVLDPDKGDLLIVYGSITLSGEADGEKGEAQLPYLFYLQIDQTNPDPFEEIKDKKYLKGPEGINIGICENWEGIPA